MSGLHVLADIPAKLHWPTVLGAVGFLRLVADIHGGKIQGDAVVKQIILTLCTGAVGHHHDFLQRNHQVLHRAGTTRLAHHQPRFGVMLAAGAGHHQVRAGFIQRFAQVQVADIDLACTAPRTRMHRTRLRQPPRPFGDVDLVAMRLGKILGPSFAQDAMPDVIEKLIDVYVEQRTEDERFIDTYQRIGIDPFKERVYAANH